MIAMPVRSTRNGGPRPSPSPTYEATKAATAIALLHSLPAIVTAYTCKPGTRLMESAAHARHRRLRRLRPPLAARSEVARDRARGAVRQRDAVGRGLRRGHDVARRRGGARRPAGGAASRPRGALLRHGAARLPRQDQCHGDPRRARPRPVGARLRHGGRPPPRRGRAPPGPRRARRGARGPPGPHARAARRLAGVVGATKGTVVDDLGAVIGNTGTAHAGLLLAHVLARAAPEQLIAVVSLADGCDVTVWRTTGGLAGRGSSVDAATRLEGGGQGSHANFLTWRGLLRREPPRRPGPQPPEAPPAARAEAWKFAFTGSRCQACGVRHLPPQRMCVKCHAVDRMAPERLADVPATIATFTVDRLAYSLSPPVVAAVIDFEGGGRFQCELTDVDPGAVRIGDRVAMTFRRLLTAGSVHNYFWKARPIP